jgi:indolepyruvate ferredoxin oxidoreductase
VSLDALERAISLNGVSVEQNLRAFSLGRLAAHDPEALRIRAPKPRAGRTLDELIDHRAALLAEYQDEAYAEHYRARIAAVRCAERDAVFGREDLTRAAAISYAKLLAYKDEYEVARLYTKPVFLERLQREFAGRFKLQLLLAPPLWARRDRHTGRPRKSHYGRWMLTAMRVLARLKFLRGTAFDLFGYTADRRLERDLIRRYEQTLDTLLAELGPENHALAVKIASLPQEIRGFDLVKQQNAERVRSQQDVLLEQFAKGDPHPVFDIPLLAAEDEL